MKASHRLRISADEADPSTEGNRSGATFIAPPTAANPSASLKFMSLKMLDPCHPASISLNLLPDKRFYPVAATFDVSGPAIRMIPIPRSMQTARGRKGTTKRALPGGWDVRARGSFNLFDV